MSGRVGRYLFAGMVAAWRRCRKIFVGMAAAASFAVTAAILYVNMDVRPRLVLDPETRDGRHFSDRDEDNRLAAGELYSYELAMGFTADGKRFAVSHVKSSEEPNVFSGRIQIWDATSGAEVGRRSVAGELEKYNAAVPKFSPGGRFAIVHYRPPDHVLGTLHLLDLTTLQEQTHQYLEFHFAPDDRYLALETIDERGRQVLKVFDPATGQKLFEHILSFHGKADESLISEVTFLADGRTLAYVTERPKKRASHTRRRTGKDAKIKVVNLCGLPTGVPRPSIRLGNCFQIAFSPDADTAAVLGYRADRDVLQLWSLTSRRVIRQRTLPQIHHRMNWQANFNRLQFSADGRAVIVMCCIPTIGEGPGPFPDTFSAVAAFDVPSLQTLSWLNIQELGATAVSIDAFEDDSATLLPNFAIHRYEDKHLRFIDVLSGRECFKLSDNILNGATPNPGPWNGGYEVSPDRRLFAQAQWRYKDHRIREWLAKYIPSLEPPEGETQQWIRFWDIETGREYAALPNCGSPWNISGDGRMIATLCDDGRIRIWDLPPRKPLGLILAWSCVPALLVLTLAWWRSRRHLAFQAMESKA